jgi:hypothetical protein
VWLAALVSFQGSVAWTSIPRVLLPSTTAPCSKSRNAPSSNNRALNMILKEKENEETKALTPDETTQKYGLEAGLFQSLQHKNSGDEESDENSTTSAGALLKKYGIAYLVTSIPLAIISFSICYFLVDNGVDVCALLQKIPGLASVDVGENGERVGTAAIAYAAHKAASPIRFPPTVLLTPVVAKLIGKEPNSEEDSKEI